jgi:hypothetical protein
METFERKNRQPDKKRHAEKKQYREYLYYGGLLTILGAIAVSHNAHMPTKGFRSPESERPPTPESIFKYQTEIMAGLILDKVKKEQGPLTFPDDPNVKDSIAISLETGKGSRTFDIKAFMKMTNGKPDPQTTYLLMLAKEFPNSSKLQKSVTIWSPEMDPILLGPNWHGENTTFSKNKKVTSRLVIDSLGLRPNDTNGVRKFTNQIRVMLEDALKLPIRHDGNRRGEPA